MVSQLLDMLGEAVGIGGLDGVHDPGVQRAAPVLEQAPVGHVVREGVLEGGFRIREQARLVQELRGLDPGEAAMKLFIGRVDNGAKQDEGHVLADDGRRLQQPLLLRGQPVDPVRQDRRTVGATWMAVTSRVRQALR
jgi:hypothetical protein